MNFEKIIAEAHLTSEFIEDTAFECEKVNIADASKVEFKNVRFKSCFFDNCDFSKSSFYECSFDGCMFVSCIFTDSYFRNCNITDCKAEGNNFDMSHIRDTVFSVCDMRYSGFVKNVWERVRLERCNFREASLSETKFKLPVFNNTDFTSVDFFKTSLKGIDLSSCEIGGISVSDTLAELRGAKLTAEQAVNVAQMLGIKIK